MMLHESNNKELKLISKVPIVAPPHYSQDLPHLPQKCGQQL